MGLKNLPHVCQKFKKFTISLVPCAASLFLILLYQSVMEVSIRRTSLMKRNTFAGLPSVSFSLTIPGTRTLGDLFVTDWHIEFY